ncbi:MAG: hypothetical protein ACK4UO_12940 [Pseudolabrys sp.]
MVVKVTMMGKEIPFEQLPAPEPSLESQFKSVVLSAKAIDLASQIVPETNWKSLGIHTWLSQRAEQAFRGMKVGATEAQLGRLKYTFEFIADEPVLQKVVLT